MKTIEQIIKEKRREDFYNYYISLGYDHKTAACLALFTYGEYRFNTFSMNELYEALCREEEYLPPEEIERRKHLEEAEERVFCACASPQSAAFGGFTAGAADIEFEAAEYLRPMPMRSAVAPTGSASSRKLTGSLSRSEINGFDSDELASYSPAMAAPAGGQVRGQGRSSIMKNLMKLIGKAGFATDEYERIEEKDARSTAAEPTSTFRMTTNTASAGVVLNQLRNERRIDRSMVRIEEMLNYFRYDSGRPEKDMFNISSEIMDAGKDKKYLYINVQGREEVKEDQNIIILLDVSGSMGSNTEETQAIMATIVSKLGNGDKLSLVTYSSDDRVELDDFTVNGAEDRIRALEKILSLNIYGGTWGSKGIEKAYEIGKKYFIEGGNNQVILITDGDLNFGITDKGGLQDLIDIKKKSNLFLSVIGTGLYNYKDDKLEALSKHGNGVYRVVNGLTDVRKSVDEEYSSLVNIIAKDVKAQVEFNPEVVESYRLLGFENRTLAREDFANDKVISEPFGSGGYGVALYELNMKADSEPVDSGLKYSKTVTTGSEEPGTVKVRYKEPLEDTSHEIEKVIETADSSYTDNLRLAFIVYACAEKLRGSDKISTEEIELAKKLYKELGDSIRDRNAADLYKLAGILEKTESELGIGIEKEPFPW